MDEIRVRHLTRVDGFMVRSGRHVLVCVSDHLPRWEREAVARYLRRAAHSAREWSYATANVRRGEACCLPALPSRIPALFTRQHGRDTSAVAVPRQTGYSRSCGPVPRSLLPALS